MRLIYIFLFLLFLNKSHSLEISYQGRISKNNDDNVNFTSSSGFFKFAIVDSTGEITFWSNDSSSLNGEEPASYVLVPFPEKNGVFQVALGSSPMTPLNSSVFTNTETYLRIWFSEDSNKFDLLEPDEKITAVAYSFNSKIAETVVDSSLQLHKLSNEFSGMTMVSESPNDQKLRDLGFVRFGKISSQPWINANTNQGPPPLVNHTSINVKNNDDGIHMILWGGSASEGSFTNQGWIYDSVADSWQSTTILDAPIARIEHSAVIHDDKMFIWGGVDSGGQFLNNGGIYNITKDSWTLINPDKRSITKRKNHSASIVGSKMVIWGGSNEFDIISDGAIYDFNTGQWQTLLGYDQQNGRKLHTATVYKNSLVFIFGGQKHGGLVANGIFLNPVTKKWIQLDVSEPGPSPRVGHTSLNADGYIIVWGGKGSDNIALSDGYMLKVAEDTLGSDEVSKVKGKWIRLRASGSPSARYDHTANWTGVEMLIFGGEKNNGVTNSGYAYDLLKDSWRSLTTRGNTIPRTRHTSEWTGNQLIVFGGLTSSNSNLTSKKYRISNTQLLDPQRTWHLYRKL